MRVVLSLSVIGGLTALALQLDADCGAELCDCFQVPQYLQVLQRENNRTGMLEVDGQTILQVMANKEEIAREVLAGRLKLRDAAARLRDVGQAVSYDWDHYRWTEPNWSEERRCCQYVIDHIRGILLDQNQDPAATVRVLELEADECR